MSDDPTELRAACRKVLEDAWRPDPGYCVPNQAVYPHQWLWDSCFHSVAWSALGDQRAVTEVESVLANQGASGFVPHMNHWDNPTALSSFWGRDLVSCITQPPMYGHALAVAHRAGLDVPVELVTRAVAALEHLLRDRPRRNGLVCVLHPWETGCDDSARWDDWRPDPPIAVWRERKAQLVGDLRFDTHGAPIGSTSFEVPSVGFSALIEFNARELVDAFGVTVRGRDGIEASLGERWDPTLRTWTDADSGSGRTRTLDALLPALVDPKEEVFADLLDPAAYGGAFGPAGAHRGEPTFDPDTYWRGPAWPQLTYLLAVAARRAGVDDTAAALMDSLRSAALANGFAEYWNADTGQGHGAAPQTWTTLAAADGCAVSGGSR